MLNNNSTGKQLHTEKPTIWVAQRWPETVENALCEKFNVILNRSDRAMTSLDMSTALQNADAVMLSGTDTIDLNIIDIPQPRTKIIAQLGSNHSHIDVNTAERYGFTVTRTPDDFQEQSDELSDLAISLICMVAQRSQKGSRVIQSDSTFDIWSECLPCRAYEDELKGKTLGIIGFGSVGQDVACKASKELGMHILAYGISPVLNEINNSNDIKTTTSIDELLPQADYVLLSAPHDAIENSATNFNNQYLIDAHRLNLMKSDAYLINLSQGSLIDTKALTQALWFETIAGVGICMDEDVSDYKSNEYCYDLSELRACENVVVLPHVQKTKEKIREATGLRIAQNIKDFFEGILPQDKVHCT
ncbi:NAD(P)-dependent oxidoreductase [Kiloniella sp.]|uniref:NAD(P)-dependent oxidoreductase n=1 Tax=Kiloniella sp. TaxID=1938587 RepID=UPI003B021EBB